MNSLIDQLHDQVIGRHSQMQVINARGLVGRWKQPVFVDFDTKITPEILDDVIKQLYRIDYVVIVCVCDCGSGNQGLCKLLGISYENTWISHPITNDNIYFFSDAPHILKLVRNWFLDTGFRLNDGKLIKKEPIKELLEVTTSEVKVCHKLTLNHITCEGPQRQRVRLASQLLSHSTASALHYYEIFKNPTFSKSTADFVEKKVNSHLKVLMDITYKNKMKYLIVHMKLF